MKNIKDSIEYVASNKQLPAIMAKQQGIVTFKELSSIIKEGKLKNDTNREEELDTDDLYIGKVHHGIRYVSGISEKGQLMASVLRDRSDKNAYIRDNGTMFGLLFGEYFDLKIIDGNTWVEMCNDIIDEYEVDDKDSVFINYILSYFAGMSEAEKDVTYSLKDVVTSSDDVENFYYNSNIMFVINLMNNKQHQKDMINTNLQPNPWVAYNYYMNPHKISEKYIKNFLGKNIISWAKGKDGLSKFPKSGVMSSFSTLAQSKKVHTVTPLYIAYCVANFCKDISEVNEAYAMIVKFASFKDKKVSEYWTSMFGRMVNEASYSDIVNFYDKHYLSFYQNEDWKNITKTINGLSAKHLNSKQPTALQGLHIKKFDTGMWFMCVALWFKAKNSKIGHDRIVTKIVTDYTKLLNGKVNNGEGGTTSTIDFFGINASYYQSASAEQRYNKLFQYIGKELINWSTENKKDRTAEANYRKSVLNKIGNLVEESELASILHLYPLSNDCICKVNLKTGDGLHWLHKSPQLTGGTAADGFLGMQDDNLVGNVKYKNWNYENPNQYWLDIIERNEAELEVVDSSIGKKIKRSIATIEELLEIDLTP